MNLPVSLTFSLNLPHHMESRHSKETRSGRRIVRIPSSLDEQNEVVFRAHTQNKMGKQVREPPFLLDMCTCLSEETTALSTDTDKIQKITNGSYVTAKKETIKSSTLHGVRPDTPSAFCFRPCRMAKQELPKMWFWPHEIRIAWQPSNRTTLPLPHPIHMKNPIKQRNHGQLVSSPAHEECANFEKENKQENHTAHICWENLMDGKCRKCIGFIHDIRLAVLNGWREGCWGGWDCPQDQHSAR